MELRQACEGGVIVELINLEQLNKYPIRKGKYDKKNGDIKFIYGVESVMEYANSIKKIKRPLSISEDSKLPVCALKYVLHMDNSASEDVIREILTLISELKTEILYEMLNYIISNSNMILDSEDINVVPLIFHLQDEIDKREGIGNE